MRMHFRKLKNTLRRFSAGSRKSRFRREAVLFFAPVGLASVLLLIATQNAEVLAAVWNDPQSLLAKRSPGERDKGALYNTKPERVADLARPGDDILPKERVLAMTRERPTLPAPAEAVPDGLPIELADLSPEDFAPAAFTGPASGFAAPGGGGPGGGPGAFAPAGPVVPAQDDTTPPVTVPGGEPTTPSDLPSTGPTPTGPGGPDTPIGSAVPEPETWATTILGLFLVAGAMRHRNRRQRNAALPLAG